MLHTRKSLRFRNSGDADGLHLMPNNAYPHDGPAKRVLLSHFSEEDTKIRDIQVCLVSKAAFFRLRQRMAQGAGRAASWLLDEATCSPDPAQTPPRLRPIERSRAGQAFQLKAKRDFVIGRGGRKDWVGLPRRSEAARGRDFDGAWLLAPPPSAGSKRTAAAGAGSEHGWPIPAPVFGASHRAAPRRGRAGTGDRAGRLGLGQAEGKSLLGTGGYWGRGQRCASSCDPGPLPPPPPPPSCGEAGCGRAEWRLRCFLRPGLGQCMGPGRRTGETESRRDVTRPVWEAPPQLGSRMNPLPGHALGS